MVLTDYYKDEINKIDRQRKGLRDQYNTLESSFSAVNVGFEQAKNNANRSTK